MKIPLFLNYTGKEKAWINVSNNIKLYLNPSVNLFK